LRSHPSVLFRLFKVIGTAIQGVQARQVEVAASLTRRFAIALDLSSLAFIANRTERREEELAKKKTAVGKEIEG
jgi:hypothetical protein